MKHALIAAALLAIGGTAAGCGDNSDSASSADSSPTSSSSSSASSSDDLCTALTAGSSIKDGADVVAFASSLKEAGVPEGTPTTAQKGFDVYVGVLEKVDPKATANDLKHMKNVDLSKTEQAEVQSFLGYASQTCAPSAPSSSQPSAPSSSAG